MLGNLPQKQEDMIRVALDCLGETIDVMKPGVPFASVYLSLIHISQLLGGIQMLKEYVHDNIILQEVIQ